MSRSYRKTPIVGNVNVRDSEKRDKQNASRSLRRAVRQRLPHMDYDADVLPVVREVSNVWGWTHDGKHWTHADDWWQKVRRWK